MFSFKKIKIVIFALLLVGFIAIGFSSPARIHAETIECADGTKPQVAESDSSNPAPLCATHGGIKPGATIQASDPSAPETTATPSDQPKFVKSDCDPEKGQTLNQNNCGIVKYMVLFIKVLSAIVGVAVVGSIVIGGIQYSASADDPSGVSAAKKRIMNALIALAVYIFMFAILQYLVPGGVF